MSTAPAELSPGVRRISLDAAGTALSALVCEPAEGPPRATVVAVHGAGMSAGYFDSQALPDFSLLTLGARLGYTVVALDRPGYGLSTDALPDGQPVAEQAATLAAAVRDFGARYPTGAGTFLLAHSFGGKVALLTAADHAPSDLLGVEISGCGHRYAPDAFTGTGASRGGRRSWGPLRLYPPSTFTTCGSIVAPVPSREQADIVRWPEVFRGAAGRVRVPVRFTFAEHEPWWRCDRDALAELRARLTAAPGVHTDRQPQAGHNISLGYAARAYHLRCLGFFEDCLVRGSVAYPPSEAGPPRPGPPGSDQTRPEAAAPARIRSASSDGEPASAV
ncbi:alpha/beta hydrolase [Streptomyces sp. NBC_00162]|uniref:alpha/beta hydrolase n=1 Tax=Streptomyces sp. NBC_00162 TaxID=2903629 RepID=UPI00214C31DC|nr:lysophospholipase [Streptomyces sp. NBC_00162]UUU39052.1 lysophospholipase [Streptomyces sp. NBC_00162]